MALNFKAYGDGHPLIILHGLLGSLDNWHSIARKLAEEYRVYLVDQRNHGKSPHTDEMDYPSMAEDIKEFMDSHQIQSAFLAGHSMGGKTAMQMAVQYPGKVDKLISIDMPPKANSPGHEAIFNALKAMDLNKVEKRKDADEMLQQYIDDFGIRQFLLKNLERSPEGGYQWKMNLQGIEKAYPSILAGISAAESFPYPTLFIRGGKSDYVNEEDIAQYKEIFPKSRLETIDNAGHWVHAEAPEAFINTLQEFLNE